MIQRKPQRGTFIVEFAIIAAAMFVVLFAAVELSRMIWIWNTAEEATRRGARVAAVCPIGDSAVPQVTVFATPGGGANSPILRGLSTANVVVQYFQADGTTPAVSTIGPNAAKYVRVAIVNYTFTPNLPFVNATFTLPPFTTTLPSESLGFIPNEANPLATPECGCFGSTSACI
jgi:Flp pilus assembly protein TadG